MPKHILNTRTNNYLDKSDVGKALKRQHRALRVDKVVVVLLRLPDPARGDRGLAHAVSDEEDDVLGLVEVEGGLLCLGFEDGVQAVGAPESDV